MVIKLLKVIAIVLTVSGCANGFVDTGNTTVENEWKSITTGCSHTCAIDVHNNLYCWGNNFLGQFGDETRDDSYIPKLVNNKKWDLVSAGQELTCGITTDSDLFCWGANHYGGTGTGSGEGFLSKPAKVGSMKWKSVKVIPAHLQTVCGITIYDELYCWGQNYSVKFGDISGDYSMVPQKAGDYKWKKVEIGTRGGCGININDELFCWGAARLYVFGAENDDGVLPQKVNDEKWLDVSIYNGYYSNNICAVRSDSTLFCWGGVEFGSFFEMIDYGNGWKSVFAGENDICGIKNDDSLYCLGKHTNSKFFNGGPEITHDPVKVSSDKWKSLSSGYGFKCGIKKDGRLFCWGKNDFGQIGNGKLGNRNKPEQIGQNKFNDISSGTIHTCGISKKKLYCWGQNWGQLGDGTKINRQKPVKITNKDWKSVSAFSSKVCAIDKNDKLFCWGDDYSFYSSLEADKQIIVTEPKQIDEENWLQISTGADHTCGIKADKHIYCWGLNNEEQLGYENTDLTKQGTVTPTKLDENEWNFVNASGFYSTCGLNKDNLLFCWGNYLSQCQEDYQDKSIRQISEITWKLIDINDEAFCGITEDNDLYCWGFNGCGELGIGEFDDLHVCEPTKVGEKKWRDVSTGRQITCGIDSDSNLYCWGINSLGLLGIDSGDRCCADTPKKIGTKKWKKVSTGYNHVCALDDSEKLFCWGSNDSGQLGNGLAWEENLHEVSFY
ncbi:MAG: RCC1 domain-containing protein [bacterium]